MFKKATKWKIFKQKKWQSHYTKPSKREMRQLFKKSSSNEQKGSRSEALNHAGCEQPRP